MTSNSAESSDNNHFVYDGSNIHHLYNMASFHHIVNNINELPLQCMNQMEKANRKNNNYSQISDNNNGNRWNNDRFLANNDKLVTNSISNDMTECPTKTWDYFVWSIQEWWPIYLCIFLIGVAIGCIVIGLVINCCWRYKKDKWQNQIIEDYKNKKKLNKQISMDIDMGKNKIKSNNKNKNKNKNSIDILSLHTDPNSVKKIKYQDINQDQTERIENGNHSMHPKRKKKDKKQKSGKYALVDVNEENNSNKLPKSKHSKSSNSLRVKRNKDKKRRKTLPSNHLEITVDSGNISQEEDHLLKEPPRMKSNSDPFNPHRLSRHSNNKQNNNGKNNRNSKHQRHHKSFGNVGDHRRSRDKKNKKDKRSKSRSRSPMNVNRNNEERDDGNYEKYRFTGSNQLLQPRPKYEDYEMEQRRHSSKSSKSSRSSRGKHKNKKRKRSKSPAVNMDEMGRNSNDGNKNKKEHKHKNKKKNNNSKVVQQQQQQHQQAVTEQKVNIIVNHIHHHNGAGSPISPMLYPNGNGKLHHININHNGSLTNGKDGKGKKKSIGIDLSALKARNYEDNRRESLQSDSSGMNSVEMHGIIPIQKQLPHENNMIIHEGVASDMKSNDDERKGHRRHNGNSKSSNYMGSLTNINDEGIDIAVPIEDILSDMQELDEHDDESSSFTIKSGDKSTSPNNLNDNHKNKNGKELKVDKNGKLIAPKNTASGYKLPKAKTKGQWL